jgi:hypothetical protein
MLAIEKTLGRFGARQYSEELFLTEPEYHFPEEQFDLGKFAVNNGRYKEAAKLFWQEMLMGTRRWESLALLSLLAMISMYMNGSTLFRPDHRRHFMGCCRSYLARMQEKAQQ